MSQMGRGLRLPGMLTGGMGGLWAKDGTIAPQLKTIKQLRLNNSARLWDLMIFKNLDGIVEVGGL